MSTYVDNLYAVGPSAYKVSLLLQDAADELKNMWGLDFKPSSRMVMPVRGAADSDTYDLTVWPVVDGMLTLGHLLSSDGSVTDCVNATKRKLWAAFFPNCCCVDAKKMPVMRRIQLLKRAVEPVLRFRWTRWPFGSTRAKLIDGIQRRMIGIILGLQIGDYTPEAFARRRARIVAQWQRKMGIWSEIWAKALCGWDDHLKRPRNCDTWPAHLRRLRTPEELSVRRLENGNRPATGSCSGWIFKRWFESVADAEDHLR